MISNLIVLKRNTILLDNSCDDMNLRPAAKHISKYSIDYTYTFVMIRFNILDNVLLSYIIFNASVVSAQVLHDIDNISNREPVILQLCLQLRYLGYNDKIHTPRVSWAKAIAIPTCIIITVHCVMNFVLSFEALLYSDLQCNSPNHFKTIIIRT